MQESATARRGFAYLGTPLRGQVIFDKLRFTLRPDSRIGLLGRNGAGKSHADEAAGR
jgi:ABC-type polysaccharide/polyol phosphate transport system ATPase subunit